MDTNLITQEIVISLSGSLTNGSNSLLLHESAVLNATHGTIAVLNTPYTDSRGNTSGDKTIQFILNGKTWSSPAALTKSGVCQCVSYVPCSHCEQCSDCGNNCCDRI